MKFKAGVAFPDADEFMVNELKDDGTYQHANLQAALKYVTDHRCAVDGGAHVGSWSRLMASVFERVIAVEPSPDTFECLDRNLLHLQNVTLRQVALGASRGFVEMTLDDANARRGNTGARHVTAGSTVLVDTIDGWTLPALGFLKLDVEGSEFFALQGASDTLRRCQPIVLFENKHLWTRYFGLPKDAVSGFLTAHGYRFLERISCDEIWGPR